MPQCGDDERTPLNPETRKVSRIPRDDYWRMHDAVLVPDKLSLHYIREVRAREQEHDDGSHPFFEQQKNMYSCRVLYITAVHRVEHHQPPVLSV